MSTKAADVLHECAREKYREALIKAAKDNGGIIGLARLTGIPASKIHDALDGQVAYKQLRNLAHEVERKLGDAGVTQ